MKLKNINLALVEIVSLSTWGIVFGLSLYWLSSSDQYFYNHIYTIILFFIIYIVCALMLIRYQSFIGSQLNVYLLFSLQLISAFVLLWFLPVDFLSILTIMWVAMLPHFFNIKHSLLVMLLVIISWFTLHYIHWKDADVFFQALLYSTFHFFAIMMSQQTRLAEKASDESKRLNKELLSTQHLLAEASKQNERTRIARDLHDLLGHHLTALIINLQVAEHLTEGEARNKVEQCHSLAKLLLSDVREAVSTLRDNQALDFIKMLDLISDNTPGLKINHQIEVEFNLEDLEIAKALLSCTQEAVTNTLRHSGASQFWIIMKKQSNKLLLILYDNGRVSENLKCGNGLNGMRERITELGGKLNLTQEGKALKINIAIPLSR